jgi:hypothetical protein
MDLRSPPHPPVRVGDHRTGRLGKSSLVLVEALAMATGRPLLGDWPEGRLRAWYWSGEDPNDETQRRLIAACKRYGITSEDLGDYLFVDSGREQPITIASDAGSGFTMNDRAIEQLRAEIIAKAIDVVIIDPFVNSHAVSENDNNRINAVVRAWARIADATGCAVELVHHVRKPGAAGQGETSVDDARGAGALIGAVRSARVLNAMTENEAVAAGVENRLQFFRVDNGKANLAPRSSEAKWRRLVNIDLGNGSNDHEGDQIGVVEQWEMPACSPTCATGPWRRCSAPWRPDASDMTRRPPRGSAALWRPPWRSISRTRATRPGSATWSRRGSKTGCSSWSMARTTRAIRASSSRSGNGLSRARTSRPAAGP